jgi:hypothetical protein
VKRWERWWFNLAALAVAATGFAYFWMKYLIQTDDPFAVVNHPWESAMLNLHVLASPPFILIFGIILNSHIVKKLGVAKLPNRRSGYISFGTFAAMACSGYLLQVAMEERWMQALVILHVGSGLTFAVTYLVHLVISARSAGRRGAPAAIREVA